MNDIAFLSFAFRACAAALAFAAPMALHAATPAVAATPCTYVGRLMNAEHVGFDATRPATISAFDANNRMLAETKTFYRTDSRRNYALRIPMASKPVDGALAQGSTVQIRVTEPNGDVWSGVVVDSDAVLGAPGSIKEVDIVLADCTNEYGIDDWLLEDLYWEWRYSDYYVAGETFDPRKDYDGDGASTIAEVFSGTDPFNPNDKLEIVSFKLGGQDGSKDALTFTGRPGHAYGVEVSESLDGKSWKAKKLFCSETGEPVNYLSVPASASSGEKPTIYLLPETGRSAFFRVKTE